MTPKKLKPLVGTEILTFREGETWIAAWRRFDVVAQGPSEREAYDRLIRTIAHQAIADAANRNLRSFGSAPPVKPTLLRHWRYSHRIAHPSTDIH